MMKKGKHMYSNSTRFIKDLVELKGFLHYLKRHSSIKLSNSKHIDHAISFKVSDYLTELYRIR